MGTSSIRANAVLPGGVRPAEVSFDHESGRITSVHPAEASASHGLILFPGFIDIHVHAREYPAPPESDQAARQKWQTACRKETFSTAAQAAINGGVTLFGAMPNDPIPPAEKASYARKLSLTVGSPCPAILFSVVTSTSEPWADLPYKVYLDPSPSVFSFSRWEHLENALARYKGRRLFFHAEDPKVLERSGLEGPRWISRPPEAETSAVEKILELTAKMGLKSHICHVSTAGAISLIADYNRVSGDVVTCEVTPHHLFFSVEHGRVLQQGKSEITSSSLLESNPPLRSEDDRRFLLEALKDGLIDVLATDHAPHTLEDKQNGAPGMPHLDTLGPFAGWLIHECGFTSKRVAEILAAVPAKIFSTNLDMRHGCIEPGAAASFTLLDLTASTVVAGGEIKRRGPLKTKCGWSPFEGIMLPARVKTTVVRGKVYDF